MSWQDRLHYFLHDCLRPAALVFTVLLMFFSFTPAGKAFWDTLSAAAGLAHFTHDLAPDALHIHVLSVGKADAILIESPDAALLVDTGTADEADTVLRYIEARGIGRLDAVWVSHPDSDHMGGLDAVLEQVPAEEVFFSPTVELPEMLAEAVSVKTAEPGQSYVYGDLTLEVFGPLHVYDGENDNSTVFRLHYGGFSMLFCGDMETPAESDLLEAGVDLSADVLKIAHHGSASSTSDPFLDAVSPQYAVISTGYDRNLLPRSVILKRLSDAGVSFFRTDTEGTVIFSTDGSSICITTENGGLQQ